MGGEPSPLDDRAYKHREDLIDAALCAWTVALWPGHGSSRMQVLGPPPSRADLAAIIEPAQDSQRVNRVLAAGQLRPATADRVAVALGSHPWELWPDWFDPIGPLGSTERAGPAGPAGRDRSDGIDRPAYRKDSA